MGSKAFLFFIFFISWRLITFQYCGGFCHTLTCKTEKETQMYRTDFWTLWEKARVGCLKRTASKHVYYLGWNRSPAQVGCMGVRLLMEGFQLLLRHWLIFLGSKITADGDRSHEIKRCLLLGRKAMTNLDSVLKSRDIILLTKVHRVKAMVFPVVMYGCENWTIKKSEHRRICSFKLWCWTRLLRVP